MKFKVAFEITKREIFVLEALQKHWKDHELHKVPDCDCRITIGNLLESELTKWTILDLHEVKKPL